MNIFNNFAKLFSSRKEKQVANGIKYIIAGLGNPGMKYENTRHNAGFIAIDSLSENLGVSLNTKKFKAQCKVCELFGEKVILMKPETFMNLSGESIKEAMTFYKIPPERVIILFDDISLPVGKIRIRRSGSHGGQNGMKNIINICKSDKFPRIKIGIGQKPNDEWDLTDWVISKFNKEERETVDGIMKNVESALNLIIKGDIEKAMNRYN